MAYLYNAIWKVRPDFFRVHPDVNFLMIDWILMHLGDERLLPNMMISPKEVTDLVHHPEDVSLGDAANRPIAPQR